MDISSIWTAVSYLGTGLGGAFLGKVTSGTLTVARGGIGVGTLTGIAKGNGTSAFSAAVAGTDYLDPNSTIDGGTFYGAVHSARFRGASRPHCGDSYLRLAEFRDVLGARVERG